ncbi:MAG: AAA family ATPase [Myxococcota bacterium]|nr:AAA family ATPase [Myxococcota bacterium]
MIYEFGQCELDEPRCELRRRGRPVEVQPKVLALLLYLVRHRDRVVSKRELHEALWPDVVVTDHALTRAVSAARAAIGERTGRRAAIRTHTGRGYRFTAEVRQRRAEAASEAPADAGPEGAEEAFVGREALIEQLGGALEQALAGRGRCVLLRGEPGIGKTRSAEVLAERARREGARALVGRCHEGEAAPAFWPWAQILRPLVSEHDPAALGPAAVELAHVVPELRDAIGAAPPEPAVFPPDQARFRLIDRLAGFVLEAARARPALIVLDDLHWADAPSLLVLEFLARELREAPLLVVGTLRDAATERNAALDRTLAELARHPHVEDVALEGLSAEATERYVVSATGRPAPDALVRALHERSEGNPFFLRETLRWLEAQGALAGTEVPAVELPPGVRGVIARRLERLSETCREALELAAVIGREFGLQLLSLASVASRAALLECVDEAIGARIVAAVPGAHARYRFSHALVRETLVESSAPARRAALHQRVGESLEALYAGRLDEALGELARHFHAAAPAGTESKAIEYAERAAEQASRRLAHEEAAEQYERAIRALDLTTPADPQRRLALELALGDAQLAAGDAERAREVFERAGQAAVELGRDDDLVRAMLGYGSSTIWGNSPTLARPALVDRALAATEGERTPRRARLLSVVSVLPPHEPYDSDAPGPSLEALAIAREAGDPVALCEALRAHHFVLQGPDHLDEREALSEEILAAERGLAQVGRAFAIRETRAADRLLRGDVEGFERALAESERAAQGSRHPAFLWLHQGTRASEAILRGRFDEAEAAIAEATRLGQRARNTSAIALTVAHTFFLRREQGRLAEIEPLVAAAVSGFAWTGGFARVLLPLLHTELGREAQARDAFESAAAGEFADIPRRAEWLVSLCELARTAAFVGDAARAATLEALLEPYADCHAVYPGPLLYAGPVRHALGLLAATRGERDAAFDLLEGARAESERVGAKPTELRVRCDVAALRLGAGAAAERRRGREALAAVERDATALGMPGVAARARARLDAAG